MKTKPAKKPSHDSLAVGKLLAELDGVTANLAQFAGYVKKLKLPKYGRVRVGDAFRDELVAHILRAQGDAETLRKHIARRCGDAPVYADDDEPPTP